MTVNLPGERSIVVDAKAPLEAFLDAQTATDEGVRSGKLADHVRQVKDHVTKLGAKGYWDPLPSSPDFVVLFLPAEAIYMAALEQDAHLIDFGVKQNVLIASPLTLIALLRTAAVGWRQERLTINAEEISRLGTRAATRARTLAERSRGRRHAAGRPRPRLQRGGGRLRCAGDGVDAQVPGARRRSGDAIEPVKPVETTTRTLESAVQRDLLEDNEPVP